MGSSGCVAEIFSRKKAQEVAKKSLYCRRRMMADGGWRMADGGWRMADGSRRWTLDSLFMVPCDFCGCVDMDLNAIS
jgi:hypothetical protein